MRNMTKRRRSLIASSSHQGRLPVGYTEVEWIQGTGTQYSLTSCYPESSIESESTILKGDINITDISNSKFMIMASWNEGNYRYQFGASINSYHFYFYKNKTSTYSASFNLRNYGNTPVSLRYELNFNNAKLNNDSQTLTNLEFNTSNKPIAIGAFWNNGYTPHSNQYVQIKEFEVYRGNTLVSKYIPCYRNSDDVAGFYETSTGNFLPSIPAGTNWVVGPIKP